MSDTETETVDTLVASEARWRPLVLACIVTSTLISVVLLALTMRRTPCLIWASMALISIGLVLYNLNCLLRNAPTFGMVPVAVFSVAPTLLLATFLLASYSAAWWINILLIGASLVLAAFFLWWFSRFFRTCSNQAEVADDAVLIVLGGRINNGVPTLTVQNRLSEGARLWREAPQRMLLVTGGPTPDGMTTEADAMAQWLIDHEGVPQDAIIVEREALNTVQNIDNSRELIRAAGLENRQLCIVTSDYHLYRALELARPSIPTVVGVPAPVPVSSALQQWCREALVLQVKGMR